MIFRRLFILAASGLWALPAGAQLNQYTLPGAFAQDPASEVERVARALENSRWSLGKLHLDPWLSLRNLAYTDQEFLSGEGSDPELTATVGVGLRSFVPLGTGTTLAAHVLPEYVWWQESSDRRRFNGRYGIGLFSDSGRTAFELSATRDDGTRFFSRELEEQVDLREDAAEMAVELGLVSGLSGFLEGSAREHRLREDKEPRFLALSALDRDERVARGGLRYRFARGLRVGLGVETLEVEFQEQDSAAVRDTTGETVFADMINATQVWSLRALIGYQSLDIGQQPAVIKHQDLLGRFHAAWKPTSRVVLEIYGNQNLVYSFQPTSPFFQDRTVGLGARTSLRSWASFRLFVEGGDIDFTDIDPVAPRRIDDFETLAGDLRIGYRGFSVLLGITRTEYLSTLPEFDRTVTTVRSSVAFGYKGLSIGTQGLALTTGELSPWG